MRFAYIASPSEAAFESSDDAYRVFGRMLDRARPPSDWDILLKEARAESKRLAKLKSPR